jgi:hypothetical protein
VFPQSEGDCGNLVCLPPSGWFFPIGATTVNCFGVGWGGQIVGHCSFQVTVRATPDFQDDDAPIGALIPIDNPFGGLRGKPVPADNDGFFEVDVFDTCDPQPYLIIGVEPGGARVAGEAGKEFFAGPFRKGSRIKITESPGAKPECSSIAAGTVSHVKVDGPAVFFAVDAAGNASKPTLVAR